VKNIPTVNHLLEELMKIKVDPDEVHVPVNFTTIWLTKLKTSLKKPNRRRRLNPSPRISPAGGLFRGKQATKEVAIKTV